MLSLRRLIIDHNIPRPLLRLITGFDIRTTKDEGWHTLRNGELLAAAEQAGFDVMLTADKRIRTQQNLSRLRLALVVISSPLWPEVQPHVPAVQAALDGAGPGSYTPVQFPRSMLRRRPWVPPGP